MKRLCLAVMALFGIGLGLTIASPASARVQVSIDLTHQRMTVNSSTGSYVWPISSARSGFSTPRGSYAPTSLERMHYSRKYHMSPMPYSIFFRGGYAIHGTYATGALGQPASHGCVRLAPGNAAALYAMVQREGASISISGSPPGAGAMVAKRMEPRMAPRTAPRAAVASRFRSGAPMGYAPTAYAPPGYYYVPTVEQWQDSPYDY